jgi:hypothetical protein
MRPWSWEGHDGRAQISEPAEIFYPTKLRNICRDVAKPRD